MNAPNLQAKPHAPTLVYALVGIVTVVVLYHLVAGRRH